MSGIEYVQYDDETNGGSVGIGGDPINGSSFTDHLKSFEQDPETSLVAIIGEIGGPQEAEAATKKAQGEEDVTPDAIEIQVTDEDGGLVRKLGLDKIDILIV